MERCTAFDPPSASGDSTESDMAGMYVVGKQTCVGYKQITHDKITMFSGYEAGTSMKMSFVEIKAKIENRMVA